MLVAGYGSVRHLGGRGIEQVRTLQVVRRLVRVYGKGQGLARMPLLVGRVGEVGLPTALVKHLIGKCPSARILRLGDLDILAPVVSVITTILILDEEAEVIKVALRILRPGSHDALHISGHLDGGIDAEALVHLLVRAACQQRRASRHKHYCLSHICSSHS